MFALPYVPFYLYPLGILASEPFSFRGALAAALIIAAGTVYVASWCINPLAPRRTTKGAAVTFMLIVVLSTIVVAIVPGQSSERWWFMPLFSFAASPWVLQAGKNVVLPGAIALVSAVALVPFLSGASTEPLVLSVAVTGGTAILCGISRWSIERQRRIDISTEEKHRASLERDRQVVSSELHDVLGQELAGIAIKSQLVERLLEAGDQSAALQQSQEIGELARAALDDVRAVVARTRDWSVAEELAGAEDLLRAAGIAFEAEVGDLALTGLLGTAYARVIREGTTNVLRHSSATWCVVQVKPDRVVIRNNGLAHPIGSGSGLVALAQQVKPVGRLEWGSERNEWELKLTAFES